MFWLENLCCKDFEFLSIGISVLVKLNLFEVLPYIGAECR